MKKRFMAFFLILCLCFFNTEKIVYANAYTPVVAPTSNFIQSAGLLAPVLAPFAPEIALVAAVCVSAGVIYQNREQIIVMGGSIYNDLKSAGYSVVNTVGKGYSISAEGVSFIKNKILELKTSTSISVTYPTPLGFVPYSDIFSVTLPPLTRLSWNSPTTGIGNTVGGNVPWKVNLAETLTVGGVQSWRLTWEEGGVQYPWITVPTNTSVSVTIPTTGEMVIDNDFPNDIFTEPNLDSVPYVGGTSVAIPSNIPITNDNPVSGDWIGDLVGSQDWTSTFPKVEAPEWDDDNDIPLDVPIDVPIDTSITDALPNGLIDKIGVPRFNDTLKKINEMDTTRGVPPVIKFDLNGLFLAATSRFGSPQSPFHAEPYTLIDFGILQNYSFAGISLIDYFRSIVGMGFILTTTFYV